jgi:uncharacterized protein (DUF2141 family)
MNKGIFRHFVLLSTLLIITGGCAKISAPSGGPRDKLPPVVLKTEPENGSKNFHGNRVEIFFDEYVVLDKISEKFMASPPTEKKPRVFIKNKSVVVEFDGKLRDSTTYTFYFMDAIRDLNEGNILDDYQFVFSTGPVIDSLSVTGNVYNAFTLDPPEQSQVLMYRNLNDSAVIKTFPDYISRVGENGYFRINNIRPGTYRLYALNDEDNSKTYNRTEEAFAFMDTLIVVTPLKNYMPVVRDTAALRKKVVKIKETPGKNKTDVKAATIPIMKGIYKLYSFLALNKDHYLAGSSRDEKYRLSYILSLPPDTMKFHFSIPGTGEDKYIIEKSRLKDTILVWLKDSTLYSESTINTVIDYPFTDSLGITGYKTDTVKMRFTEQKVRSKVKARKPAMTIGNNIKNGIIKPGQTIVFTSQTPFRLPDTTKIRLYEFVDTNKLNVPYNLVSDSIDLRKYNLDAKLTEGGKYLLVADSASFGDIFNDNIDSTGIMFSVKPADSYSRLTINIQNCDTSCIIQLLDKSEKILAQAPVNRSRKVVFSLLDPGTYRLRIIYDLNGDGKWTTGDFYTDRQPEPVSFYPNEIDLKTGWDLNQDWNVAVRDMKEDKLRAKKKKTR